MERKITAFVARSFDSTDELKIAPITKFLESFKRVGFFAISAEPSEVELVSAKVRSVIDDSDVLVGIFTKRHPVYALDRRVATAIALLRGKIKPTIWTAPPWVIQESGYALKGRKALILLLENGVEIPGLQGDLEYIPFDPNDLGPALQRASEMINDVIADARRIKIETTVNAETAEVDGSEAAPPPKPSGEKPKTDESAGAAEELRDFLIRILEAARKEDWAAAAKAHEDGLVWTKLHAPEREISLRCFYQRALFDGGHAGVLSDLRNLAREYPDEYIPLKTIAACLTELHEYDEAAGQYHRAALVAKPERRAWLQTEEAEALQKARKPEEARRVLLSILTSEHCTKPEERFAALQLLYSVSKEIEDKFVSFAVAELALHHSPEDAAFRFSLAYDYDEANKSDMSLFHYKIICDRDESNSAALNNLGVALANCDLTVLAARRYKAAYDLGNTLSASNLGRRQIESGLADDAIALLAYAQTKKDCAPEVSRTLAAADEKIQENNREQNKVLERADEQRAFLVSIARGRLAPEAINLTGQWTFQSLEIDLTLTGTMLLGLKGARTSDRSDLTFAALALGGDGESGTRIEQHSFTGTVSGRTCKFELETTTRRETASTSLLGAIPSRSKIEGYIVFAEDGNSGRVAELKDGKPEKYYTVSKQDDRTPITP